MRPLSPTRLIPLALLAAGIGLTGLTTSMEASTGEAQRDEARIVASKHIRAHLNGAESRLDAQADRAESLADVIIETVEVDRIGEQVTAFGAFDRDSAFSGVFARRGSTVVAVAPDDSIEPGGIPLVPEGLTAIDRGPWNSYLAYGVDTEKTPGAEIVILIDRPSLARSISGVDSPDSFDVSLFGLPGGDPAPTNTSGLAVYPDGMLRDGDDGPAYLRTDTTFLGEPVALEVVAPAELVWLPASRGFGPVPLIGALLSILAAGAAFVFFRVVGRAESARKKADLARQAATARFRASFTNAPIGVVELSSDGVIVAANPRFASQLGYVPDDLSGADLLDLVDGEDRPAATSRLDELLVGGVDSDQAERRYRSRNGGAVWVREAMSALVSEDGSRHLLVQAEDISDERRARAELHRKALFDDLTGLPNRANLIARLNRAIDGERAPGEMMAVMFVDLDKFKQVNDTLGHEAGDLLLIEVADRLRRACRSSDTVARFGGDEFVVVCEGLPDDEVAENTANRFAEALRAPMFLEDVEVPVSASIGLVINSEASSPEDLLRQADQAMYRAKTSGRNQLIRFDIEQSDNPATEVTDAAEIREEQLRNAIDGGQLRIQYQPVMRSEGGGIVGLEALVRWQHPDLGMLTPPMFLPLAEELQLVEAIDAWVLEQGMAALGRWTEESPEAAEWFLAFNISPTNYNKRDFASTIADDLEKAGVRPDRLVLERNETWFMTQTPTAVVTTRELRALGVRISLDHFGTGSSSLSEVSTLEFDILKIDRSFVRDASSHLTYVLEALKNMADALDLKAIVEGIETEAELMIVRKAGIEFGQGFHMCRPLDEESLVMQYVVGPVDQDHQVAEGSITSTS